MRPASTAYPVWGGQLILTALVRAPFSSWTASGSKVDPRASTSGTRRASSWMKVFTGMPQAWPVRSTPSTSNKSRARACHTLYGGHVPDGARLRRAGGGVPA